MDECCDAGSAVARRLGARSGTDRCIGAGTSRRRAISPGPSHGLIKPIRREDVPGLIRGFYAAHIGADRNWPDVAYNFFVDRYGVVWEGRSGSLAGPVKSDATGYP